MFKVGQTVTIGGDTGTVYMTGQVWEGRTQVPVMNVQMVDGSHLHLRDTQIERVID